MEETQVDLCFNYLATMLTNGLTQAEKLGYPYLLVYYDIVVNNMGMAEPVYEQAYVKDLNDIFHMIKSGAINIASITVFDVATGNEIDKSIFRKGE